ncbi:MAG: antibiotic biosynthesis monooxygenase [Actinobacteria bacterium]|nr:antibiotic biosynthesis monooxygenase [Actinomycetota bacterium]
MIIVTVSVSVKPEMVQDFIGATKENAKSSTNEPGIIRFDFIRQADSSYDFLLVEAYKNEDAISRHKQTAHYNKWKNTVENMMSVPRKSIKYTNVFPDDANW